MKIIEKVQNYKSTRKEERVSWLCASHVTVLTVSFLEPIRCSALTKHETGL